MFENETDILHLIRFLVSAIPFTFVCAILHIRFYPISFIVSRGQIPQEGGTPKPPFFFPRKATSGNQENRKRFLSLPGRLYGRNHQVLLHVGKTNQETNDIRWSGCRCRCHGKGRQELLLPLFGALL